MKTLGQRIKELREAKDLSLRELAKKLGGLSAAFLSDIELGKRHPSDPVLTDMARVLGTSVEDLKQYDTRPPVDEIRRLSTEDPAYGFALRKMVDKGVKSGDLLDFLNRHADKAKKKA